MILTVMRLLPWSDHPNVWTDGSLVLDRVTGVSSSGAGFFAHQSGDLWDNRRWGHVDVVRLEGDLPCCRGFFSGPGPLQSVQLWGVILALQSSGAVHFGVDNLCVVRHVGRLLDGCHGPVPYELVKDGDLLLHINEGMVLDGRVRDIDRLGDNAADEAADFGRRRVGNAVIDDRRNLSGVCGRWYPGILDPHRLFIAISRAVVNHDGRDGSAPDPMVWSAGARPKRRRLVHAVRDRAFLHGPPGSWDSEWVNLPASAVCAVDIAQWPYTPGLLDKWVSFSGSLHWPAGGLDLGVGGVPFVELLLLYELWAGERLSLEKGHPRYLRPGRPISVSAVPFGPGIDIWRSCRFIGTIMRSLCLLPGGANHCRLRHIGWEKSGHGLTSRPLSLSWMSFLVFFVILQGLGVVCLLALFPSVTALFVLLVGPLLGGYMFLFVLLIWLLPVLRMGRGSLLTLVVGRFLGFVILVWDGKEFDSTEKTLHTSRVWQFNLGHVCGKDCIL